MGEAMEIRTLGDGVLRKKAHPVKGVNRALRALMDRMLATMYAAQGIGLAAPQVGVSKRVIVADIGEGPIFLANPEIIRADGEEIGTEGCLSVPGKMGEVKRFKNLTVTGLDREGQRVWIDAAGLLARVFQHEIDHLDGILFIDRAMRVWDVPPETALRIVFMGTPEFAAVILGRLVDHGCHVVAAVTQPDRPKGRGHEVRPSPVKEYALQHGIKVLEPVDLRDAGFLETLAGLKPDVIVTAAYGRIIPKAILDLPPLGCLNVHPSLLPAYRGAAPIHHALLNGDAVTGVTIIKMTEELDAGDILLQEEVAIEAGEDRGTLERRLAAQSAEVLIKALRLLATGEAVYRPQDHTKATYAPMLTHKDEVIDWSQSAASIVNKVRAFAPMPGAATTVNGRVLKILGASVVDLPIAGADHGSVSKSGVAGESGVLEPGRVIAVENRRGFVVACGEGAVLISVVKPAGRKVMSASEYLNGHPLRPGDRLGN